MATEELHCIIAGRVQMVMFRDFTQRKARSLGVSGWVKNLPDGTVEVLSQGERPALEELLRKLRRGPILARVEDVRAEWREATDRYGDFSIMH